MSEKDSIKSPQPDIEPDEKSEKAKTAYAAEESSPESEPNAKKGGDGAAPEKKPDFLERFEMKEPKDKSAEMAEKAREKRKTGKVTPQDYVKGIIEEMRRVTWPSRAEVAKWSVVVLATIGFFTLFTFLVDNFIASPIIYGITGFASGEGFGRKAIALTIMFFAFGLGSAVGVMLHSGGDQAGMSESLSMNLTGGSAIAEKNLDRLTLVMIVLFVATLVMMTLWFPVGTVAGQM